ncbi:MAG: hypothetical protein H0T79_23315, partial [Deltaproteobacteria bacterium]|nr:hypothetical protein [Deltaproteobacteria bacterium]
MRMLFTSLLFAGCTAAYADQHAIGPMPPGPQTAIAIAPAKVRAPYDVQVIREGGETSPTFAKSDRFYVQGNAGERYTIRITNPTPRRVEAVVTVDGLDVIDGEAGDLRKRGYVVPAYGEVRIEGFRTSTADVATFRFSSVSDSYAGQKGKARNVGVIAAAIFEETAPVEQQQIVVTDNSRPRPRPYNYRDDLDARGPSPSDRGGEYGGANKDSGRVGTADHPTKRAPAPAPAPESTSIRPSSPAPGGTAGAPARPPHHYEESDDYGGDYEAPPVTQERSRPGLGTEFGEQRYSAASYTRFTRANNRPIAVAELRYNDVPGLM